MGAGGALFVNQSADVTLTNVSFANNNAKGGDATIKRFAAAAASAAAAAAAAAAAFSAAAASGGGGGIFGVPLPRRRRRL